MDDKKLNELHAMASELMGVNSSQSSTFRKRMAAMISGGYDFADTLHNIFVDYGYPLSLEFSHFWNMYRRFGVARKVIELPTATCWQSEPEIEGNERFMREFEELVKRVDFFTRMKGLDTRQRVGRYAGMFMRVKDGKSPDQPLEGTLGGSSQLVEMMPLYESQLEVVESDTNPQSETYGDPVILQYSQSVAGSRNEESKQTLNIHASRIVFAAEGADDGWIYGIPALEPIFNSLMDLRKVIGGGAEGFYKNASQSIVFNLTDPSKMTSATADKLEKFNEQYDDFTKNRMRRSFWTPGMETQTLDSSLVNPKEFAMAALNDVAAGCDIPATILIGQQTGRLASTEDGRQFLSVQMSRRKNVCTPMLMSVLQWMMRWGILPKSDIEIEWDDLLARSDQEKLENAGSMAKVNESQFKSGGEAVFTSEEIREAGGYDSLPEEDLPDESLPEDDGELPDE